MPQQKRDRDGNEPVSFRPGALQRDRLNQLIECRQQNQSTIINAALDLLWLLDIGFERVDQIRQADILTNYGQNDISEEANNK